MPIQYENSTMQLDYIEYVIGINQKAKTKNHKDESHKLKDIKSKMILPRLNLLMRIKGW